MQAQVAKLSQEELDVIAKYVATLKDPKASVNKESDGEESKEDEKKEKNESN